LQSQNNKFELTTKTARVASQTVTQSQTLVTKILRISLSGYKELSSVDFRLSKKLAQGGGGTFF
jgi:hypothetical protein